MRCHLCAFPWNRLECEMTAVKHKIVFIARCMDRGSSSSGDRGTYQQEVRPPPPLSLAQSRCEVLHNQTRPHPQWVFHGFTCSQYLLFHLGFIWGMGFCKVIYFLPQIVPNTLSTIINNLFFPPRICCSTSIEKGQCFLCELSLLLI